MDELLVTWLSDDEVYSRVLRMVDDARKSGKSRGLSPSSPPLSPIPVKKADGKGSHLNSGSSTNLEPFNRSSPPPPVSPMEGSSDLSSPLPDVPASLVLPPLPTHRPLGPGQSFSSRLPSIRDAFGISPAEVSAHSDECHPSRSFDVGRVGETSLTLRHFVKVTKDLCGFPTFFNAPLFRRIRSLYPFPEEDGEDVVTLCMFERFWNDEMAPYDRHERFFRLVKRPDRRYIHQEDFHPYVQELLDYHPGLDFLSNHTEFQEKYAVTVITRIFYVVNRCHNGKITVRQIRRSNLLDAFHAVDEEEDINKVTQYFSYEHFYVLYCRFWELDHDRDYRITREDLLRYSDHSLSHMIVDRIFDAAPRPFPDAAVGNSSANGAENPEGGDSVSVSRSREHMSYEDFIFFMLSEEDKSNEISVRYWFSCIDVDGDGKLNNMEMRSFYAVQLHRMQCLGHEIVPFEDMLCQMIDMIKPRSNNHFVVEDFLQPECERVSGALFEALFNLNKYLLFEQKDPFKERTQREDEFESDWDRFACVDYSRLAMEEEAREEEVMEIDWVTVDDDDDDGDEYLGNREAPF
eukprot:CAMPEP_0113311470 /NCGR_PEP_ID=MMETSP0010_2-20120614/8692_1 /TAXON_ID=216773 ORGANISM="Corethron hystrix, Strain 308" /NCGR_SAMPLE_ID=MMETSP0010_2 /ASSEMBLY_ACC=CAM_ASM_000155 /LENGTH=574 /DNA_ID=CAMNT_0000167111 /DNA_START=68 /DNA_END=1792 /DNA_ORIENTATION=+ /assembly_acc=CAM_ASM_000155